MSKQLNLKKQIVDQSSHLGAAFLLLTPLLLHPSLLTAMLAGFGIGLVREVTSRGTLTKLSNFVDALTSPWSCLDMAFWAIGGGLAWLVWN